ncbi:hypothetical protein H7J88_18710 [Mycolicibacterium flavescens]|nr:hypothetical protein [Mycolicibacterium flavescens]MCV7281669.1 hypothetical protein [Mycolicibacterium flavescens]
MNDSQQQALTTREKILLEGEDDWVKLQQIHDYVASEDRSASLSEVQRRTLALVRSMAEEGVIALGEPIEHGARFKDWEVSLDEAVARLAAEYIDRFDERLRWPFMLWVRVTDKGRQIGKAYERVYAAWLSDLRAQGREYEPLPMHLVPGGGDHQPGASDPGD